MNSQESITIKPARSPADLRDAATLFEAYAKWLNVDLTFQDFSTELSTLPGRYAPPSGEILLARGATGAALGCVGVRPISPEGCCEMKRLYVLPEARGLALGKRLVKEIVDITTSMGYSEIRLDTLQTMTRAIALYEKAGFVRIARYYDNPYPDVVYLGCKLQKVREAVEMVGIEKADALKTL